MIACDQSQRFAAPYDKIYRAAIVQDSVVTKSHQNNDLELGWFSRLNKMLQTRLHNIQI